MRAAWLLLLCTACNGADNAKDSAPASAVDSGEAVEDDRSLITACLAEPWVRQTCSGCHLEGSHLDLRFDALETLVQTDRELHSGPIVVPGDADGSLLVRKLEAKLGRVSLDDHEGEPMPPDTDISADDVQLIRDWVDLGAVLPIGC